MIFFVFVLIKQAELENGEDVARCPSCSLIVRVIYDLVSHFKVEIEVVFIFLRQYGLKNILRFPILCNL